MGEPLTIGLVAGEPSGDLLGGSLMSELQRRDPTLAFCGVGGSQMLGKGLESVVDMDHFAINGFVEPLKRLPMLYKDLRLLVRVLSDKPVAAVVGIDFNFFNQMLELRLRRRGIRTIHYVSPSVWAWRQSRIRKIRKATDVVMTLFPFETKIYHENGIRAEFVGHPLADQFDPAVAKSQRMRDARQELDLDLDAVVLGLFPGSRRSELEFHTDLFLQSARRFGQTIGQPIRCVLPVGHTRSFAWLQDKVAEYPDLSVLLLTSKSERAHAAANVSLIKSGTSTLEALLLKTPMVVAYRIGGLTYNVVSSMLKTEHIALPNILADDRLVPEFIQQQATVANLATALTAEMEKCRDDSPLLENFSHIHKSLKKDAAGSAAQIVLDVARGH